MEFTKETKEIKFVLDSAGFSFDTKNPNISYLNAGYYGIQYQHLKDLIPYDNEKIVHVILMISIYLGDINLVSDIIKAPIKNNKLNFMHDMGDIVCKSDDLYKGEILDIKERNIRYSPLSLAIRYRRLEIVKILIEHGASIYFNHLGITPFMIADELANSSPTSMEIYRYIKAIDKPLMV